MPYDRFWANIHSVSLKGVFVHVWNDQPQLILHTSRYH
jgi:hypothetical protein